jgi:DNA adenine methylase
VPKNAQAAEARSPKSAARIQTSYRKPFPVGTSRCDVRTPPRGVPTNHSALHDTQLAFRTVATDAPTEAQPFLKWVGGKGQLLDQLDPFFPEKITRYFEPFVGGGAVFFHLKHRFPRLRAFLRDINPELINTYRAVRDRPQELMRRLDQHAAEFKAKGDDYFYLVRSQHDLAGSAVGWGEAADEPASAQQSKTTAREDARPTKKSKQYEDWRIVERAARMIFLNKTCFNGLWRVNARGEFNVPVGSYKNPRLYDEENLWAASRALQDAQLEVQDFRRTFGETRPGDFLYVDPPYHPLSTTASFTSYAKEEFGEGEQRELHAVFAEAARRGVRVMLSNSDTRFIRNLYGDFPIHTVQARRAINSDGSKRGNVNEVVVSN